MAGSNGSPAQRGGPSSHWPTESEEQARALEMERWRQEQALLAQQQRGYPQANPQQQGYAQPTQGYGQPAPYDATHFGHPPQHGGYGQPGMPEHNAPVRDPFEPPFGDATQHPQGHQYANPFDRFAPVPPAQDVSAPYDPHRHPARAPEPVHDPFNPHTGQAQAPFDARQGFDPNHGYAAARGHAVEQGAGHHDMRADPQSWDFSNYHPGQLPQGYQGQPAGHDPHAPPEWGSPAPAAHDQQWPQLQGGQGHWGPDVGLDQHGQPPHPHYDLEPGYEHGEQHLAGELAGDDYDLPEEPRRGPSVVLVIGMLIGAIVVGGGLAVAYRHFGGGGQAVNVAEIKRQTAPEKVRPQDPGGKTIEHSNNVFLNRSGGDGGAATEARQNDVDGSAKKVATIPIVVNRDGSLTPQSSNGAVPPMSDTSGVPGLLLDGLGPPPSPPQLRPGAGQGPAEPQASRLPPPPPPVERAPPRIADLPLPKVTNAAPAVTAAVERPVPPPVRKPAAPEREDRATHRTASAAVAATGVPAPPRKPAPSVSQSGYVAVLASKRSRQEALNAFADLHSQYPEILSSVTPDVREANLGDKGVWYRLIGGPPGSREAARGICVKLKARGMKDCWPVAY